MARNLRRLIVFVAGVASIFAMRLNAQESSTRFQIAAPTDTTFTIPLGDARWVKGGMTGVVVDPTHDDALVATFSIRRVEDGRALAVATGLTTGLAIHHRALLTRPRKSFLAQRVFWVGSVLGIAVGYFIGRG